MMSRSPAFAALFFQGKHGNDETPLRALFTRYPLEFLERLLWESRDLSARTNPSLEIVFGARPIAYLDIRTLSLPSSFLAQIC